MAMETSFLLIESDWSCERAYRLVDGMPTRWVVVRRSARGVDLYYPFKRNTVLKKVPAKDPGPVGVPLNLEEIDAAPTAIADTGNVDSTTVIVNHGRVVGIVRPVILEERDTAFGWRSAVTTAELERAIEASAPAQVALGGTVPLVVTLVRTPARPEAVKVTGLIGEEIDVVVQASGGLAVEEKTFGTLKIVERGTPSLLFKITGQTLGPGQVSVLLFQQGQSVGSLDVAIETVAQVSRDAQTVAATAVESAPPPPPDLALLVLETNSSGGAYTMYFTAADPALGKFPPLVFTLRQDPRRFFADFYSEIDAILSSGATARQKMQRLADKGTYLFQQLSPEAQRTLWNLRGRIRSVHVSSEDPWVPWELLKLFGDNGDGTVVEAGFLCEDYEVTRWVPRLAYKHDLTMQDIGIVVPSESGLSSSRPERDAMMALATPERHVTPIEAEEVVLHQVLAGAKFDVIHFTGHGRAGATTADRAEILLDAGSTFRPDRLTGETWNLGKRSPIVFLNACEIGRAGMGLTKPGGYPRGFLDAGAGAFIGPFWRIGDASAAAFAASFYQELLSGASIGAAALTARLSIRAASDPTWLAYSVYAHCDARLAG